MQWWQPVSMVGSVVVMMTALATLGWRVLERMRIENQIAHDKIGESIVKPREDPSGDTAGLRSDMDANFAKVRDDIGEVREGLAELRGEFKGVNRSLQDFREDFRVHVYGGTASA